MPTKQFEILPRLSLKLDALKQTEGQSIQDWTAMPKVLILVSSSNSDGQWYKSIHIH